MRTGKIRILSGAGWVLAGLAAIAISGCAMQRAAQADAPALDNGVPAVAPYQQLATGGDLALREPIRTIFSG